MPVKNHRKNWTINEVLQLQREFELLQMSIVDIAAKHERTISSIVYKIHQEGFKSTSERGNKPFSPHQYFLQENVSNLLEHSNKIELEDIQKQIASKLSELRNNQRITRSAAFTERKVLEFLSYTF